MRRSPRVQDSPVETRLRSEDGLAHGDDHGRCGHRRPAALAESAGAERPPASEAAGMRHPRSEHLHTATAARAFFSAANADLSAFGRHVAMLLASALAGRRSDAAPGGTRTRTRDNGSLRRCGAVIASFVAGIAVAALLLAIIITGGILWALHNTPIAGESARSDRPSLVLEAADGRPLGRTGPLTDAANRSDFPDVLVNAVLSIEDRRFYRHLGIDPLGVLRAARVNLGAGEIVEGGSTITQQLVKLRLVGRERTMERKLREAFAALWLDFRMDKDAILTEYLNRIYLGAGAYGVSSAARVYFGKRLAELSVPEAAMLAGLIKAPSDYNPIRNAEVARQRAAQVLDAMVETGAIDARTAAEAKAAPAQVKATAAVAPATSWFADWIAKHEFPKVAGGETRSIKVRTTLVPELQQAAEKVIAESLEVPRRGGPSQAALVAMRPDGAVLAMVGGRDYDESQFNRAADARRQPGSAFKLFVYLAALRSGYSPNDVVDASPIRIKRWEPENFGGRRYGTMTLAQAFAQSVNTAAVRLATEVGLGKVVAAARDLGIDAPLPSVPSLALGTAELTLVDLTGAFASVRAGRRVDPFGITAYGPENQGLRTLGAPTGAPLSHAESLIELLRSVVTRGTGRGADTGGFVAGKTGTSQDHRDAWFIGFTETLVVGVWVGNDDHSPMRDVTGGSVPAQIWRRFVEAAGAVARFGPGMAEQQTPASAAASREAVATDGRASAGEVYPFRDASPAAPQCDLEACADAYDSFRASDCTYKPRRGPRRACAIVPLTAGMTNGSAAQAATNRSCDVNACARRYRSFDPTDCSYQPYGGGPRRLCDAD
jgi:1A family penicillin-binding protein